MILDTIENFDRYVGLNPLFPRVAQFLASTNLSELSKGRHNICGDDLFVNITDAQPKTREQAQAETHNKMIDIQVPISGGETHGWMPRADLPAATYDASVDMTLYGPVAQTYLQIQPGQFLIYFPTDGHAPAITDVTVRKAIFKVKA